MKRLSSAEAAVVFLLELAMARALRLVAAASLFAVPVLAGDAPELSSPKMTQLLFNEP